MNNFCKIDKKNNNQKVHIIKMMKQNNKVNHNKIKKISQIDQKLIQEEAKKIV